MGIEIPNKIVYAPTRIHMLMAPRPILPALDDALSRVGGGRAGER